MAHSLSVGRLETPVAAWPSVREAPGICVGHFLSIATLEPSTVLGWKGKKAQNTGLSVALAGPD